VLVNPPQISHGYKARVKTDRIRTNFLNFFALKTSFGRQTQKAALVIKTKEKMSVKKHIFKILYYELST